jgi:hypothetical protein
MFCLKGAMSILQAFSSTFKILYFTFHVAYL